MKTNMRRIYSFDSQPKPPDRAKSTIAHDHSINQARYAGKALEGQLDIA
jgi:hypothetical protein